MLKFSIVIPTLNEEQDIEDTLDKLIALRYPEKEILVVDESSDDTPQIVSRYSEKGVRLIKPQVRGGRCEARNLGIMKASGDVVVILNADVRPSPDFLSNLAPYYEGNYDYVLVQSKVTNSESLLARYVEVMGSMTYRDASDWMEWTEGFSCRRELAIRAGLFPTGFVVPICAGEDGYFGERLRAVGARKMVDMGIVVNHIAPSTLSSFWRTRKGRGKGSPQVRRFLEGWSMGRLLVRASLRIIQTLVYVVLVIPMLVISWRATRHSSYGIRDLFPLMAAWLVERMAFHVGEWGSIFEIRRAEQKGKAVISATN